MTDREKLTDLIYSFRDICSRDWAEIIAGHLVSHGATIPVRCKDCKWWRDFTCTNKNGANGPVINGIWFCAAGERKDNDS